MRQQVATRLLHGLEHVLWPLPVIGRRGSIARVSDRTRPLVFAASEFHDLNSQASVNLLLTSQEAWP